MGVFDMMSCPFLYEGSRDGTMALWKMNNEDDGKRSPLSSLYIPEYAIKLPQRKVACQQAERIRSLAYDAANNVSSILVGQSSEMPVQNLQGSWR